MSSSSSEHGRFTNSRCKSWCLSRALAAPQERGRDCFM